MTAKTPISDEVARERANALPAVRAVRDAAAGQSAYLVGGAVRDLLLGEPAPTDLDVAIEGDVETIAAELGAAVAHERFGTAAVQFGDARIDLARTRAESYAHPGALPEVVPAGIEADLARRDFTVNAMAMPLDGPASILDPHEGKADLAARLLRVLHPRSFIDDPTRSLRAARYAARLGFELEQGTRDLLGAADLSTVSADRVQADLRRIAEEPTAAAAIGLLAELGLAGLASGAAQRVQASLDVLDREGWQGLAERGQVVLAAAMPDPGMEAGILRLASTRPAKPSEAVALARGRPGVELVLARAAGAAWLDRFVGEWRHVRLEISGDDLLTAGVREGPAVGRGLGSALAAKLDGEANGRDQELAAALKAAAS